MLIPQNTLPSIKRGLKTLSHAEIVELERISDNQNFVQSNWKIGFGLKVQLRLIR